MIEEIIPSLSVTVRGEPLGTAGKLAWTGHQIFRAAPGLPLGCVSLSIRPACPRISIKHPINQPEGRMSELLHITELSDY